MRARSYGAEGIGLCRTEHMFFEADRLPIVHRLIMAVDEETRVAFKSVEKFVKFGKIKKIVDQQKEKEENEEGSGRSERVNLGFCRVKNFAESESERSRLLVIVAFVMVGGGDGGGA